MLCGYRTEHVLVLTDLYKKLSEYDARSGINLLELLRIQRKLPKSMSLLLIDDILKHFHCGNLWLHDQVSTPCVRYGIDRIFKEVKEAAVAVRTAFSEAYGISYAKKENSFLFECSDEEAEKAAIKEIKRCFGAPASAEAMEREFSEVLHLLESRKDDTWLKKKLKTIAAETVSRAIEKEKEKFFGELTSSLEQVAKFVMALKAAVADEMEKLKSKNEKTGA